MLVPLMSLGSPHLWLLFVVVVVVVAVKDSVFLVGGTAAVVDVLPVEVFYQYCCFFVAVFLSRHYKP